MTQQIINNGDTGLVARTAINDNFTELYPGRIVRDTVAPGDTSVFFYDTAGQKLYYFDVSISRWAAINQSFLFFSLAQYPIGSTQLELGGVAMDNNSGYVPNQDLFLQSVEFSQLAAENVDYIIFSNAVSVNTFSLTTANGFHIFTPAPFVFNSGNDLNINATSVANVIRPFFKLNYRELF